MLGFGLPCCPTPPHPLLPVSRTQPTQHVMLSYEWGCQSSVMLIKNELQKAGYQTWMDIDKMSGEIYVRALQR